MVQQFIDADDVTGACGEAQQQAHRARLDARDFVAARNRSGRRVDTRVADAQRDCGKFFPEGLVSEPFLQNGSRPIPIGAMSTSQNDDASVASRVEHNHSSANVASAMFFRSFPRVSPRFQSRFRTSPIVPAHSDSALGTCIHRDESRWELRWRAASSSKRWSALSATSRSPPAPAQESIAHDLLYRSRCTFFISASLHAATYRFEPEYTQGIFRWNHLGFLHPAAQFSQGEGTLEFDAADPTKSSVTVALPLAKVTTGIADLDEEFQSSKFFETAKFPTATFKSSKVERGAMTDQLKVSGELTLHGVTKPIMRVVTIIKVGTNSRNSLPTAGDEATAVLKRSDGGLGTFVPQVSDEIRMDINAPAADAKAYAEQQKAEAAEEVAKAAVKT